MRLSLPINFEFNTSGAINTIRVIEIDGEPWFVSSDVFIALNYASNARTYQLSLLAGDEKGVVKLQTPGGRQNVKVISESGLYKVIMRSNKREAGVFQDWVTRVVLPAIRKDGGYITGEEEVATGACAFNLRLKGHAVVHH